MRKIILRIGSILGYLLILLYLLGFKLYLLLNVKLIILVAVGAIIMSIPYYHRKMDIGELLSIVGHNAMTASYIETFILLFIRLSENAGYENLLMDIALACRPILYGCFFYIVLRFQNDKDRPIFNSKFGEMSEKIIEIQYNSTQVYYMFRQLGLTEREAEIANHICKGMSNGEIAEELCISETTVKKHVSHIFEKLQISKREQVKEKLR